MKCDCARIKVDHVLSWPDTCAYWHWGKREKEALERDPIVWATWYWEILSCKGTGK